MSSSSDRGDLRILMLTEDFYPKTSGGAFTDWKFAQMAVERGHSVTVYADRMLGAKKQEVAEGVDIRRPYRMKPKGKHVNSPTGQVRRILISWLLTVQLLAGLRNSEFDVIYSTNHSVHPVAKVLSFVYGLPVVNFVAYSPSAKGGDQSKPKSVFVFEEVNFRHFMGDLVVCRTPEVVRMIRSRSSATVDLIGGVVNQDDIFSLESELRGQSRESKRLVFVGRLVPIKNTQAALRVLANLPDAYSLSVIGDGPESDSLEMTASELGVQEGVEFAGRLSHEKTLKRIACAEALVLTSRTEAYPTVVFEALSLSTEVFATPVGILPEIEHEHLHLSEVENMPNLIDDSDLSSREPGVDQETLNHFSMKRFTDEALDALYEVTEQSESASS